MFGSERLLFLSNVVLGKVSYLSGLPFFISNIARKQILTLDPLGGRLY